MWLNHGFPQFAALFHQNPQKKHRHHRHFGIHPAPYSLQVIVMEQVMQELMSGKKYAKKMKKTLYICPKTGQYVSRCLPKAQSKKS
jgi:hypothetical protein